MLHVGNLEPRKDIPTLARAAAAAGVPLVLAGGHIVTVDAPAGAQLLGHVAAADLPALYAAATVVGYVSRYEGFGLPPIEAMACGATVMATRVGAIAEVAGEGIELVPIGDVAAQAAAIRELVNDPDRRAERRRAGLVAAGKLSWAATAARRPVLHIARRGVGPRGPMNAPDVLVPESTPASRERHRSGATGPPRVRGWVVACTGLALAVGFAHLQRKSLGHEEGFTWSTVDRGFPALLSVLARSEGYQILHSLIEWPTNRISSTVDALRTPSVLAFAAAVPAVWLAGRRLFDERTGLLAALLFALNGFALQYAQEARGYMLATMLCAYSAALLAQHVLAPRRWSRAAWIVVSALTIYAHGFAVLAIAAQVAALWFLPASRRRELHWIRDGMLIALCAAPAILAPVLQINSGQIGFIPKPGLNDVRGLVWSMSGRTASAVPVIGLGVAIALVAAAKVLRRSLHSVDAFRFALPILWMIVPSFVLLSGSLVHPVWLDRYVLWSVGAVVVLAAYGLTRIAPKHMVVVAAVFVIAAGLAARGIVKWYGEPPYQDYRSAMCRNSPHLVPRVTPSRSRPTRPGCPRRSISAISSISTSSPLRFPRNPGASSRPAISTSRVSDPDCDPRLEHPYRALWIVDDSEPGLFPTRINELRSGIYSLVSDRFYTGGLCVEWCSSCRSVDASQRVAGMPTRSRPSATRSLSADGSAAAVSPRAARTRAGRR